MRATLSIRSGLMMLIASLMLTGCGWFGAMFTRAESNEPNKMSVEQLYRRAKESLNAGSFAEAIKLYETLESRFPYGVQAQQAILDQSYAHYKLAERAQSVAAADRYLKLYPQGDGADYALYMKGLANFIEDLGLLSFIATQDLSERDQKSARDSYAAFKQLTEKYPSSRYHSDSLQRMRYLVNALSMNEVHIARYYFNRGAYQAAIARAQSSITSFPNTPGNEEALRLIVQSHKALGNTQLAADTERVYRATYQSSPEPKKTPWWKIW
ncbi:MAG: outer membrane protein assembly factor BamD [Casimicrobium sp.]